MGRRTYKLGHYPNTLPRFVLTKPVPARAAACYVDYLLNTLRISKIGLTDIIHMSIVSKGDRIFCLR